jgi:hypothetical protein
VSAPFTWWWPALAVALTLLAVLAASNYALAVPAAAAAVAFAAIAVGETLLRLRSSHAAAAPIRTTRPSDVRDWLRAGGLGREELVLLLDRLERKASRPDLPARTPKEIGALLGLRPEEFRQYLTARLAALEGMT